MINNDNHALTEVALALAMAFFAMFVLALVSISGGHMKQASQGIQLDEVHHLNNSAQEPMTEKSSANNKEKLSNSDKLVLFYKGKFYTPNLEPVLSLPSIEGDERLIVAFPEDTLLKEVMTNNRIKNLPNLSIAMLNNEWKKTLEMAK